LDNAFKYLALSGGKLLQALASSSRVFARGSLLGIVVERAAYGLEQRVPGDRFFKEVDSAGFHRSHTRGDIRVTGQKYHRESNPMAPHGGLQIEPRWPR
jgi:hypothetical protein